MPRGQRPYRTTSVVGVVVAAAILASGCAASSRLTFDQKVGASPTTETPTDLLSSAGAPVGDAGLSEVADGTAVNEFAPIAESNDPQSTIEAQLADLVDNWVACFHQPGDCDPTAITAPESPERARLTEAAAYYTAEQISTRPDEGRLEWDIEALTFADDNRARVMVCEYDTRVFFDVSMADTLLGDIIFDTTIWTRRVEWTLSQVNGTWTLWSRHVDRRSPVARFCTP